MPLTVKCPNCQKEAPWENNPHRPFCSNRCQLIDLGAWSEERYRIPNKDMDTFADDPDDDDEKTR